MYAILYRLGRPFEFTPTPAAGLPYPKTLGGLQLLVNGIPAAITSLQSDSVYFLVPNNAPTSGEVEYLLTRPATGEIIAAGTFTMGKFAPGFFTVNQTGTQQIAATNFSTGTPNGPSNPVGQDEILTLWMTGYGHLDNAPPDGEAPTGPVEIPTRPVITIGGLYKVPPEKILYSGLSGFPGLWQINIRMPKNGEPFAPAPNAKTIILVQMEDQPSNIGFGSLGVDRYLQASGNGLITTIATK